MFSPRRALPAALALLVPVACLIACKEAPPSTSPPPRGLPPLEAPAAGLPPGLPSGHPGVNDPGAGGITGEMPKEAAFDEKTVVRGVIRLAPKMAAKVKAGDVLFLMARAAEAGGQPGALLAVKKLTAGTWPAPFELDNRDAMMVGTAMHGRVIVMARVDKDGDAISKNPGDVIGKSEPVELPADKVIVTLDTAL